MALFMTQFAYTTEAWQALARNPVDRSSTINAIFESVGGKLINLYYSLGEYDGVVISEAPDTEAVTAALIAVVGAGHVKAIRTTSLLSAEEMVAALKRSGSLSYGAPA
jgi:uncharacterized protein with GYD domain